MNLKYHVKNVSLHKNVHLLKENAVITFIYIVYRIGKKKIIPVLCVEKSLVLKIVLKIVNFLNIIFLYENYHIYNLFK